jgi:uncharacterized protein YlxP (DUF503 family)
LPQAALRIQAESCSGARRGGKRLSRAQSEDAAVTVSLIRLIIEIPGSLSLKDKRQVVSSLKDKIRRRYRVSVAEVDLQESLTFAELGAAYVSNSRELGEQVMNRILRFVEDNIPGRVSDVQILSERY